MKFRLGAIIFAAGCIFALSAYASEDPETYPFPDDFSFDDLPEIEPLPPLDGETPPLLADTAAAEAPTEATPEDAETPLPRPVTETSSGQSTAQTGEQDIFLPGTDGTANEDAFATDKSLTETLKEADAQPESGPLGGTWVEKLTTSNPLSLLTGNEPQKADAKLEEMVQKARGNEETGRSNASVFDIAGVMLRMSLDQTERTLQNRGFRKVNARFQIPNFIKWRNEESCRNEGVVGYERLEACVIDKAKKDGHQYLQYLKYVKYDTKEEMEVYFTSNFTENKVYKIVYRSRIASITGNSPKAVYIRNIKIYDFWKRINQKYGQPDNKTNVTWGMGGDKPYLKADSGYLLLEDPMFRELDYTRMSREDQRFINSDFYTF